MEVAGPSAVEGQSIVVWSEGAAGLLGCSGGKQMGR